jgi:hypothetical protein
LTQGTNFNRRLLLQNTFEGLLFRSSVWKI